MLKTISKLVNGVLVAHAVCVEGHETPDPDFKLSKCPVCAPRTEREGKE